jgi:hypothetical protein
MNTKHSISKLVKDRGNGDFIFGYRDSRGGIFSVLILFIFPVKHENWVSAMCSHKS